MLSIFEFDDRNDFESWVPIDDVVMGGSSFSAISPTEGGKALFHGFVSLEAGGGFASVRSTGAALDLSAYEGLLLHVRGDGKRYRMRLRNQAGSGGVNYDLEFKTRAEKWQEIWLTFDRFEATFRGAPVPDAPPLDLRSVQAFGLLIARKQAGRFFLEIDWIRAANFIEG